MYLKIECTCLHVVFAARLITAPLEYSLGIRNRYEDSPGKKIYIRGGKKGLVLVEVGTTDWARCPSERITS